MDPEAGVPVIPSLDKPRQVRGKAGAPAVVPNLEKGPRAIISARSHPFPVLDHCHFPFTNTPGMQCETLVRMGVVHSARPQWEVQCTALSHRCVQGQGRLSSARRFMKRKRRQSAFLSTQLAVCIMVSLESKLFLKVKHLLQWPGLCFCLHDSPADHSGLRLEYFALSGLCCVGAGS